MFVKLAPNVISAYFDHLSAVIFHQTKSRIEKKQARIRKVDSKKSTLILVKCLWSLEKCFFFLKTDEIFKLTNLN